MNEGRCEQERPLPVGRGLTFDVNLGGGVVCAEAVGGDAGVASCVVLEGLADHQRVQDTITGDLYVGGVVQLSAFAEPPGRR